MIFQKGDLVKLDVGVQIQGRIGDNALTLEVGNGGNHTDKLEHLVNLETLQLNKCTQEHPGIKLVKLQNNQ